MMDLWADIFGIFIMVYALSAVAVIIIEFTLGSFYSNETLLFKDISLDLVFIPIVNTMLVTVILLFCVLVWIRNIVMAIIRKLTKFREWVY